MLRIARELVCHQSDTRITDPAFIFGIKLKVNYVWKYSARNERQLRWKK